MLLRQVRVTHGRAQVSMAHRFLHVHDVAALGQPGRSATMAQVVLVQLGRQLRPLNGRLKAAPQRPEPLASLCTSPCPAVVENPLRRPGLVPSATEAEEVPSRIAWRSRGVMGSPPRLAALRAVAVAAGVDQDEAVLELHVFPPQPQHFAVAARTGLAEREHVQAQHRILAGLEQALELIGLQNDRRTCVAFGRLHRRHRIAVAQLEFGVREQRVQHRAILGHRARAHRAASLERLRPPPGQEVDDVALSDPVHRGVAEALHEKPLESDQAVAVCLRVFGASSATRSFSNLSASAENCIGPGSPAALRSCCFLSRAYSSIAAYSAASSLDREVLALADDAKASPVAHCELLEPSLVAPYVHAHALRDVARLRASVAYARGRGTSASP